MEKENEISSEMNVQSEFSIQEQQVNSNANQVKNPILIVEDDDVSFLFLATILKKANYNFIRTTKGADAINILKKDHNFFLILMDIKMPGLNGIATVEIIREFNTIIPIIAQTAYALSGDKEMLLKSGFNEYISKPIKKDQLFDIIKKYS
jgi:CheY-like chemotaxis protein